MKRSLLVVVLVAFAFALAQSAVAADHVHFARVYKPGQAAVPASGLDMTYYGGPIMYGTNNSIYIVYYGNWDTGDQTIINSWAQTIGGSGLYNTNTTFYDGASPANYISAVQNFNRKANTYHDNYSLGKNLTDADIQTIVSNAIAGGHLPNDVNGFYFVLTYLDVFETAFGEGFCTAFCGYHTYSTSIVSGENIKYSFVGDSAKCPSGCDGNVAIFGDKTSPNQSIGADGAVSVMTHELSEGVTDPQVTATAYSAWGAGNCGENGDCCAWTFGTTSTGSNSKGTFHYNETFGGRNWLIQQLPTLNGAPPSYTNVPVTCVQSH
jgi:hypothetical protein